MSTEDGPEGVAMFSPGSEFDADAGGVRLPYGGEITLGERFSYRGGGGTLSFEDYDRDPQGSTAMWSQEALEHALGCRAEGITGWTLIQSWTLEYGSYVFALSGESPPSD